MNGLTGKKMQNIFKALVPESVRNEARCLVEYCCFRFLSRDNSDVHPSLKVYKCSLFKFMLSLVFKINGRIIPELVCLQECIYACCLLKSIKLKRGTNQQLYLTSILHLLLESQPASSLQFLILLLDFNSAFVNCDLI